MAAISDNWKASSKLSRPASTLTRWICPLSDHAVRLPSEEKATDSAAGSTGRDRMPLPSDCATQTVTEGSEATLGIWLRKRTRFPSREMLAWLASLVPVTCVSCRMPLPSSSMVYTLAGAEVVTVLSAGPGLVKTRVPSPAQG